MTRMLSVLGGALLLLSLLSGNATAGMKDDKCKQRCGDIQKACANKHKSCQDFSKQYTDKCYEGGKRPCEGVAPAK